MHILLFKECTVMNQPHKQCITRHEVSSVQLLSEKMEAEDQPRKDGEMERPIPTVWRPIFRQIVQSFVTHDYYVKSRPHEVSPIDAATAKQIREYIDDYGEKLIELPEGAWESSVCIWMEDHWDVLIDLWSEAEGRSDLVLSATVSESSEGYIFNVYMVYVP